MAEEELGKALAQARMARGLTLRDVERDTRISTKYLEALEAGNLDVLPAPVYARAFTRTYSQYLGLNAAAMVQRLPGARPEPELPPLPDVGREAVTNRLSASWGVAGVVVVLLLVFGFVLFWNRGGDGGGEESVSSQPEASQTVSGQGAEAPTAQPSNEPSGVTVTPGQVPNLVDANVLLAVQALQQASLPYVIIEMNNGDAPEQTVFDQSPSAATAVDEATVVTLLVSR